MPDGLRELRVRTKIQCQHGCGETGRYTYSGEVISADPMRVAFGQTGRISAQLSNAKVEAQGLTSPSGSHGALAACCATLSREAFHNRSSLWCSGGHHNGVWQPQTEREIASGHPHIHRSPVQRERSAQASQTYGHQNPVRRKRGVSVHELKGGAIASTGAPADTILDSTIASTDGRRL